MTAKGPRRLAGTLLGRNEARLVELFGIEIDAELQGTMLYIVNTDTPGFIGRLGTALGDAKINIATFNLGRRAAGGEAVALVAIDGDVPASVEEELEALPGVLDVVPLHF
jgi:D-3-phosphoglycerate dehydrogenase